MLDEDGNGMLSSIEFRHGLREHLGCKDLEMSELEGVLRLLDTNGDGGVDIEEFWTASVSAPTKVQMAGATLVASLHTL